MGPNEPTPERPLERAIGDAVEYMPGVSPRAEGNSNLEAGAPGQESRLRPGGASTWTALALFVAVVFLFLAFAPFIQGPFGLGGLVALQVLCVLVPALFYLRLLELPLRPTLNLRRPAASSLVGSLLMGSSVWYLFVVSILPWQNRILPPSEEFLKLRESLFTVPETAAGWAFLWACAALTPAICEEVFFRGVLLHSSRVHLGTRRAIVLVSFLFALFHFNPYQLSITFLLGLLLGWLLVRTGSLLCCMAFHLANNSAVLAAAQVDEELLPLWLSLVLVAMAIGGLLLVIRAPKPGDPAPSEPSPGA